MSIPARLGQYLYATFTGAIFGAPSPITDDAEPSTSQVPVDESCQFESSLRDVLEVKHNLCKGLTLPMELVDAIVDFAEYWPHTTTMRKGGQLTVRAGHFHEQEKMILRSYPLGYLPEGLDVECKMSNESSFPTIRPQPWPTTKEVYGDATDEVRSKWLKDSLLKGDHPCRKIVFTIKSHDQGWGGEHGDRGTYKGSFTWFDVGKEELVAFREGHAPSSLPSDPISFKIEDPSQQSSNALPITCALHTIIPRTESSQTTSDGVDIEYTFHQPLNPEVDCLQRNMTATRDTKEHKITWSCDDNIDPDSVYSEELEEKGRGRATATGEFVRNMRIGDVVTVWAKARYQGWANTIEEVKIDVYWAV